MMKLKAASIIIPDIHGRSFWKEVFQDDCPWETRR